MAYARRYAIVPGLLGYSVQEVGERKVTLSPKPFESKEKAEAAIRRLTEAPTYYDENGEAV
jgi:hypothetical protein